MTNNLLTIDKVWIMALMRVNSKGCVIILGSMLYVYVACMLFVKGQYFL